MPMKVYVYDKCDTCRKALKYLDGKGVDYRTIPIVEQPPTVAELKKMAEILTERGGSYKNLFNTSGIQYRELGIADKLKAGMTANEAIQLLAKNGKLIKRPFALSGKDGTVGFKEAEWKGLIG